MFHVSATPDWLNCFKMTGLTGGQGIDLSAVQILYKVHYTGSANFHSVQLFTASLYSPGVQILYKFCTKHDLQQRQLSNLMQMFYIGMEWLLLGMITQCPEGGQYYGENSKVLHKKELKIIALSLFSLLLLRMFHYCSSPYNNQPTISIS